MKILKAKNGIKYYCYDKFDYIALCIKKSGDYETEIKEIAKIYLSSNIGTVVDIGSNIGTFCIPLAKIFLNHDFESFEILNHVYKIHLKNNQLNSTNNIKLTNLGISNIKSSFLEKVPNYEHSHNIGGFSIDKMIQGEQQTKYMPKDIERLYVNRLDNLNIKNLVLIKIDTEGHELEVLKGAKMTIKKFKPLIIFETNNKSYYFKKNYAAKIFLFKLGYEIQNLNENSIAYYNNNHPVNSVIKNYIYLNNNFNNLEKKNYSIKYHFLQIVLLLIKFFNNKLNKFLGCKSK
jgi:FkbM family methyltransferase